MQIDRDNIDEVMERMTPGLNLKVENTLAGDGSQMAVDLAFKSMADFDPANVAEQVEPLRKMLATRNKLRDLLTKVDRSAELEELLEKVLRNEADLEQFARELGTEAGSDQPKGGTE